MDIRVGETRRPPTSRRKGDSKRRRRGLEAKKILADREKEGVPAPVRAGRIQVQLNPDPAITADCPSCGHGGWRWQETCSRCGEAM